MGIAASRLAGAIAPRTRVVGVHWVHSCTGVKLPRRRLAAVLAEANRTRAESERVMLFVDGVHGFGVEDEPIALTGVDPFAAGTHKWMFAPRGTGVVWAVPAAFEFHAHVGRSRIAERIHALDTRCKVGLAVMKHVKASDFRRAQTPWWSLY